MSMNKRQFMVTEVYYVEFSEEQIQRAKAKTTHRQCTDPDWKAIDSLVRDVGQQLGHDFDIEFEEVLATDECRCSDCLEGAGDNRRKKVAP